MKKGRIITLVNVLGLTAIMVMSMPLFQAEAQAGDQNQNQAVKTGNSGMGGMMGGQSMMGCQGMMGGMQSMMGGMMGNNQQMTMNMQNHAPQGTSLEQMHSKQMPALMKSLDEAIKACESGDTKTTLAKLKQIKATAQGIHEAMGRHLQPQFVNNRCPIMGSPINLENVSADLIREYKGQKVAFCCAGCPAAWDKLTAADKESKLANVLIPNDVWTCPCTPRSASPNREIVLSAA